MVPKNKFIYEHVSHYPRYVIEYVVSLQKTYKDVQVLYAKCKEAKQICCWNPPPFGFLKLNVNPFSINKKLVWGWSLEMMKGCYCSLQ